MALSKNPKTDNPKKAPKKEKTPSIVDDLNNLSDSLTTGVDSLSHLGKSIFATGEVLVNKTKDVVNGVESAAESFYENLSNLPETAQGKLKAAKEFSKKDLRQLRILEASIVRAHSRKNTFDTNNDLEKYDHLQKRTYDLLEILASECKDEKIKKEIRKIADDFYKKSQPRANFNHIKHDVLTNFEGCQ